MKRVGRIIEFILFYIKEVTLSNVRVAYGVCVPSAMNPKLVMIGLDHDMTDWQLTLLANLITMTPGTLSIDISADRRSLFIHAMFIDSPEQLQKDVNEQYARRIRNVF